MTLSGDVLSLPEPFEGPFWRKGRLTEEMDMSVAVKWTRTEDGNWCVIAGERDEQRAGKPRIRCSEAVIDFGHLEIAICVSVANVV